MVLRLTEQEHEAIAPGSAHKSSGVASNSPDMLPIENMWGFLKTGVRKRKPTTKDALKEVLLDLWNQITPAQCRGLVPAMNTRMENVISRRGDVTKLWSNHCEVCSALVQSFCNMCHLAVIECYVSQCEFFSYSLNM